jgi:acetylglutamate kinase
MEKIIVIKFGGSLFTDDRNRQQFWLDVKKLTLNGYKVVIVHGGGKEISSWLSKIGCETKFVQGLRFTDEKSIEIVEMVLSGKINKKLASELAGLNVLSIGISGRDSDLIVAEKIVDLGFVGKPVKVNTEILTKILDSGIIPIISPVSSDGNGNALNVNADDSADVIAINLQAENLIFMTDTKGVMADIKDENSLIKILDRKKADSLIKDGVIKDGMLPKINSAFRALDLGVGEINIVDGRENGVIEKIFFKNEILGTRIRK